MKKLTTKKHWESTYERLGKYSTPQNSLKNRIMLILRKLLGKRVETIIQDFSRYILLEKFIKKHLNITSSSKVIEIGCAPGYFLLALNQEFSCVPCGVDYSETGVHLNQKLYRDYSLDPENIVCADVFSNEFQNQNREFYDIVISRNFFEHFQELDKVISAHINLLKPGGRLLITIPNLKGLNYCLTLLFNKDQIPQHNLSIMDKKYFASLLNSFGVSKIVCKYYGMFNFYLLGMRNSTRFKLLLTLCYGFQMILNVVFHFLFKKRTIESRIYSPYLVYVGIKK
jgi:SAM-dependent methyltransferase